MNIKSLRGTAIAGFAAIAITAAGAIAAPSQAQANDKAIAAFVGGLVLGGIAANSHVYGAPVYVAPAYPAPRYYGHRNKWRHHDRHRRHGYRGHRRHGYGY